jgi:hypothetical protein
MGLIYIFPNQLTEDDRILIENENAITLKTYGLPMIFWGYLAAIFVVLFAMALASISIIEKMLQYDDIVLNFLAILVLSTLIISPIFLLGFFFYEKFITKKNNQLIITHRIIFIPIVKKIFILKQDQENIFIDHFLDSPNMAKLKADKNLRGFQNKGYFELKFKTIDGKTHFLDRHSKSEELENLKKILSKF